MAVSRADFIIPNLHCPTCVSHIKSLMNGLCPPPTVQNISIINHVATIIHDRSLTPAAISDVLSSAGYEIFDVVPDSGSVAAIPSSATGSQGLAAAVRRWDPVRPKADESTWLKHEFHCQMCAAHSSSQKAAATLETVTSIDSATRAPEYQAVMSIGGMTCSSCVANATNALVAVPEVIRADVALVNHSANVKFAANTPEDLVRTLLDAIEDVGYDASLVDLKSVGPSSQTHLNPEGADIWQATYSIAGMSCSSCVDKLTGAVKRNEFIQSVKMNLMTNSGTVLFWGKHHEPLIQAAIKDAGYRATRTELKQHQISRDTTIRSVSLQVNGMHCLHCPRRTLAALRDLNVQVTQPISIDGPILTISYVPHAPDLTIRRISKTIEELDPSFAVSVHKPITVEQRSQAMLNKERKAISIRALLSAAAAVPALIIGIVYMNLVSHQDPGYRYLMQMAHGVTRADWAMLVIATPVYLFADDYFHVRAIKEIWALWRPRSKVPIAQRFYRFGSMNMLISLGTTIAYLSSLVQLIIAAAHPSHDPRMGSEQSYFDSVVFLTMFLLIGRLAEAYMKVKSGDAVSALGKLRPTEADLVLAGSDEHEAIRIERMNVDMIDIGDLVSIPYGSSPPCDGLLQDSIGEFDESSLTGEARVVQKRREDAVFSGTINKGSAVTIRVTEPAGASMLDSIIQVVREGQAKRAPMERVADLLTAYFVPVVVVIAITTWIVWLSLGLSGVLPDDYRDNNIGGWGFWSLQFAIAVFVIACPCGLGLAAPTALFVGSGLAAQRGILVKGGGEAFQEASNLDAIVFDKTGTLTQGVEPEIVEHQFFDVHPELTEQLILGVLKSAEETSNHPLARAAVAFSISRSAPPVHIDPANEIAGKGLKTSFSLPNSQPASQVEVLIGNESLLYDYSVPVSPETQTLLESWTGSGHSIILLAMHTAGHWQLAASFAIADPLRPEAAAVVQALQAQHVDVWMLSGDNARTAHAVGRRVGIPAANILAGVLPAQKADKIKYLQRALLPTNSRRRRRQGWLHRMLLATGASRGGGGSSKGVPRATVAMVGDGVNDAPALAAADVGIAVAAGADVAVQSAAFVLVHSDLRAVLALVALSRAVFRRVVLNFAWAAVYNLVALPVAAGVLYPLTTGGGRDDDAGRRHHHVRLDPVWAALAMALSSITVLTSSLLLRTRIPGVGFRG